MVLRRSDRNIVSLTVEGSGPPFTHAEAARITDAIRAGLKAKGKIRDEHSFESWVPAHLTNAQKADATQYAAGDLIQFQQNAPGFTKGSRVLVGEGAKLPTDKADRFEVYRPKPLALATGDRVRITAGGKTKDGKHRLNMGLIGAEVNPIAQAAKEVLPIPSDDIDFWEGELEKTVADDSSVAETERLAIIRARNGQGIFRDRVTRIERKCRITGVDNPVHLVASHCKPWRDSTNEERLDGENGLLLTPSIDHLFDRGFIGFEDNGRLIISPVAHRPSLQRMGIDTSTVVNVGGFTSGQKNFLDFHRTAVLLQSVRI
ncbi:MAG: hypothetical protein EB060_11120 [Proteobacteria bacterium]|nr:hypothetical protein [Pseudomonadota bacterium]